MTQSRPSGLSRSRHDSSAAGSVSSSRLTSMRSAWKTRVAGWMRRRRAVARPGRGPGHDLGQLGRRLDGVVGALGHDGAGDAPGVRLLAVALEDVGQLRLRRRSRRPRWRGCRGSVSKRMSSASLERKLKPRSSSSSCWELTPRSMRMPSTASKPLSVATSAMDSKFAWRSDRAVAEARRGARVERSMALGSASMPSSRPPGLAASRIRTACPPPPTVASIWKLPGCGERAKMTSSSITGRCPTSCSINDPTAPTVHPDPGGSFGSRCPAPGGTPRVPRADPSAR